MRNLVRYVLALSVLAAGVYGAFRFRLPPEASRWSEPAETRQLILTATPDHFPDVPTTSRKPPLAVLIDTDRAQVADLPLDAQATLKTLPAIARRESAEAPAISSGISEDEKPRSPKRNDQSERAVQTPRSAAKNATDRTSSKPVVSSNADDKSPTPVSGPHTGESVSAGQVDAPRAKLPRRNRPQSAHIETKPAVEPRSTADTPSAPANLPLPKLDPRPGNRFLVPDPFEDIAVDSPSETDYASENEQRRPPEKEKPAVIAASPLAPADSSEADPPAQRHRIVPGDTLPKLAARYWGDAARYLEIFRANKQSLFDPRLLPIGLEIDIPSGAALAPDDTTEELPTTSVPLAEDPFGTTFEQSKVPEDPENAGSGDDTENEESDMEPIPPQSLPPPDFGTWQYSVR